MSSSEHAKVPQSMTTMSNPAISLKLPQAQLTSLSMSPNAHTPKLSGLSFKFKSDSLDAASTTTTTAASAVRSGQALSRNSFGVPQTYGKQNSNISINPEVMRLSAQTDDLRSRLNTSIERSKFLEVQLNRIQKVAIKDRKDFQNKISIASSELNQLKNSEKKLKDQLAKQITVVEKQNAFENAVQSAMKSQDFVQEQAKFEELTKNCAGLTEQTTLLTQRRDKLTAETERLTAEYSAMKSELHGQIQANKIKVDESELNLSHATTELENVQSTINTLTEELKSCQAQRNAHEEKRQSVKAELASLTRSINAKMRCLQKTGGIVVSGDCATPTSNGFEIGFPYDTLYKRVDDMSSFCYGIPHHFSSDAPISLTGNMTQITDASVDDNDSNTEAMLSAIVGDLKTFLAQASTENDKRGLGRSTPSVGSYSVNTVRTTNTCPPLSIEVA